MVRSGREQANKCRVAAKSRRMVVELDALGTKIVPLALLEKQRRLIEAVGDRTQSLARRRYATAEVLLIASPWE